MSIRHISYVIDEINDVTPTQKLILIILADCMNKETGQCFPSQKTIAEKTGLTRESVNKNIRKIEDKGYMRSEVRTDEAGRTTGKDYWLLFDPKFDNVGGGENKEGGVRTTFTGGENEDLRGVRTRFTHNRNSNQKITHCSTTDVVESDQPTKAVRSRAIPFEDIRKAYNEILPELPRCIEMTETRKRHVRARWVNHDLDSLEDWEKYFKRVRHSDWLMGRVNGNGARGPFHCKFDWLINQNNMIKVLEGTYDSHKGKAHVETRNRAQWPH